MNKVSLASQVVDRTWKAVYDAVIGTVLEASHQELSRDSVQNQILFGVDEQIPRWRDILTDRDGGI